MSMAVCLAGAWCTKRLPASHHFPPPAAPLLQNRLAISRRAMLRLTAPFALLLAVCCVLWGLQFFWIASSAERVMALDASERAFVYNARWVQLGACGMEGRVTAPGCASSQRGAAGG